MDESGARRGGSKAGFEQLDAVRAISRCAAMIAANKDVENAGQPEDGQWWRHCIAKEPPGHTWVIW